MMADIPAEKITSPLIEVSDLNWAICLDTRTGEIVLSVSTEAILHLTIGVPDEQTHTIMTLITVVCADRESHKVDVRTPDGGDDTMKRSYTDNRAA